MTLCSRDGAISVNATSITGVLQRDVGAGMGLQFIPRIGQEVLVDFLEGDIDRPLVIGASSAELSAGMGTRGQWYTPWWGQRLDGKKDY